MNEVLLDNKAGETHIRTTAKAITYRVLHMIELFILAQLFGSGAQMAGLLVVVVIALGTILYYIYDRVWILIPWKRELTSGKDKRTRSLIKSIGYRVLIFFVAIVVFMIVLQFPFLKAVAMSASDIFSAIIIYYIVERLYNPITWGRKAIS